MTGGLAEADVLGFDSAERDKLRLFARPINGTISKLDDESAARFDILGIVGLGLVPSASEVSVGVALENWGRLVEN